MTYTIVAMEEVKIDGVRIRVLHLGTGGRPRRLVVDYCAVDAAVFMVDAADKERLEEAKKELHVSWCQ